MLPCVSQGAAPLGRELTITASEGNIVHELAGRPALETVQTIIGELSARERGLVAGGLLIGIVIDSGKPEFEQGDFLVRGVLGADPESGSLAIGATVRNGQVVRLHARDARSADEDLRRALRLQAEAIAGGRPAGALLFSCNGRGSAMFGVRDHDAEAVERELGGAPAAGFFAAGEIGPVGGRSFLHGFTATLAVFPG
jgi:small ligand-binding sensory domain FIST